MKKLFIICLLLVLVACSSDNTIDASANERYQDLISQLQTREDFKSSSEYFDITSEITPINNGYRYYVTIDNAKVAMYEIEAIAIEKDVDYTNEMAANIGLFEDMEYSIIPGQVYTNNGFVKGINISGISQNANPTIYLCVIWHNKDLSITHREYFKLDINETSEEISSNEDTSNNEDTNSDENSDDSEITEEQDGEE